MVLWHGGVDEEMTCNNCEEWQEGIRQIVAQAAFCSNQSAGPEYTATKFRFCPWCGKELDEMTQTQFAEFVEKLDKIIELLEKLTLPDKYTASSDETMYQPDQSVIYEYVYPWQHSGAWTPEEWQQHETSSSP